MQQQAGTKIDFSEEKSKKKRDVREKEGKKRETEKL